MTVKNKMMTLLVGIYFGIVLIKSQVISWFRINDMFQFKEPYMYLVICSAIGVGLVSVFLIRRLEARTVEGESIVIKNGRCTLETLWVAPFLAWAGRSLALAPAPFMPILVPVTF